MPSCNKTPPTCVRGSPWRPRKQRTIPKAPANDSAPSGDDAAIEFVAVTKRYGERAVLDGINLKIPRGKTTVLLGPSGTGKSTLLRLAVGLERPTSGHVNVLGQNVARLSRKQLLKVRQDMGMLFQEGALFGSLTVADNISFPLRHLTQQTPATISERVEVLLDLVDLPGLGGRLPDALSGGQRKRVALARAIALEPKIVLFDEPTSGLDPQTSAAIDDLLLQMQERLGLSFVVITHDTQSAAAIAHQVGVLMNGEVAAWGTRDEVWSSVDPRVRAFLERKAPGKG